MKTVPACRAVHASWCRRVCIGLPNGRIELFGVVIGRLAVGPSQARDLTSIHYH